MTHWPAGGSGAFWGAGALARGAPGGYRRAERRPARAVHHLSLAHRLIGSSAGSLAKLYGKLQSTLGASARLLDILDEAEQPVPQAPATARRAPWRWRAWASATPPGPTCRCCTTWRFPSGRAKKSRSSGTGKSTITQLLHLYQPVAGGVCLGGRPRHTYDLTTLRRHSGLVPQEPILFGGGSGDNIAYGRPGAPAAAIERAARKVPPSCCSTKPPWPSPARASSWCASIRVSSSPTTSTRYARPTADKILVLDGGRVVEQGTHEELLTDNGTHRNLLRLQLELA